MQRGSQIPEKQTFSLRQGNKGNSSLATRWRTAVWQQLSQQEENWPARRLEAAWVQAGDISPSSELLRIMHRTRVDKERWSASRLFSCSVKLCLAQECSLSFYFKLASLFIPPLELWFFNGRREIWVDTWLSKLSWTVKTKKTFAEVVTRNMTRETTKVDKHVIHTCMIFKN